MELMSRRTLIRPISFCVFQRMAKCRLDLRGRQPVRDPWPSRRRTPSPRRSPCGCGGRRGRRRLGPAGRPRAASLAGLPRPRPMAASVSWMISRRASSLGRPILSIWSAREITASSSAFGKVRRRDQQHVAVLACQPVHAGERSVGRAVHVDRDSLEAQALCATPPASPVRRAGQSRRRPSPSPEASARTASPRPAGCGRALNW